MLSHRGGLSHQLSEESCRALAGSYRLRFLDPSLCTFLLTLCRELAQTVSAGFAQDYRAGAKAGLGSSEFTQFFNHSHLWKLQIITAGCSAIELLRITKLRRVGVALLDAGFFITDDSPERQANVRNGLRRAVGLRAGEK